MSHMKGWTSPRLGIRFSLSGETLEIFDTEGQPFLTSVQLAGRMRQETARAEQETARAMLVGFSSNESAGDCVAAIISAGIIPGGMEMMDKPAIHATEDFVHAGYPMDVQALLIVELDGPEAEVDHLIERVDGIANQTGATYLKISQSDAEREVFW